MWRRVVSLSSLSSATRLSCHYQVAFGQKVGECFSTEILTLDSSGSSPEENNPFITFVLGGPGTGKGTQCAKIVENFGFMHLSAGELLRREISSNSENGDKILNAITEGKIVPSEVSVKLIQREMSSSKNKRFLIDGFPRSEENRVTFEQVVGVEPNLVLFFYCSEEEMVQRVLSRNEGRADDNIDTMKKRLQVFSSLSLPVVDYYSRKGKLHKINAVGTVDEIFEKVRPLFSAFEKPMNLSQIA